MKKEGKKQNVIIIRLTDVEKQIVSEMRDSHAINISGLVRKILREHYEENYQR